MTTRRDALAGIGSVAAATLTGPAGAVRGDLRLIAGTYAAEQGRGLYPIAWQAASGRWSMGPPVTTIEDASFGVGGGPAGTFYWVRERQDGAIGGYGPGWSARGGMVPSGGADPCHVALDAASTCLAVANYGSGSVGFHRLDPATGAPGRPTVFRHTGSGPNPARQASAHAHWVGFSPDRRWLHAVDLGADAIFAYPFDPARRTLATPTPVWHAPPGAGPRHLIRHPRRPIAYCVCEMGNLLLTLRALPDGRFETLASASTLPAGFAGASYAAHVAIDRAGRRLYVSNRGHDSIAVFALDGRGQATLVAHVSSGGHWPRMFLLLEEQRRMLVANERSGRVAVLRITADGGLSPTGETLDVPGVVFLAALT